MIIEYAIDSATKEKQKWKKKQIPIKIIESINVLTEKKI